ncbi:MAG: hypothetical protein GY848_04655 [Methyloversatilis sp.]|nr:hypothetical protein [Methyloversatilis sp.]
MLANGGSHFKTWWQAGLGVISSATIFHVAIAANFFISTPRPITAVVALLRKFRLYKNRSKVAKVPHNIPVKGAPFGRWTLRDKAPRSALYLQR